MPRPRHEAIRQEVADEIKAVARRQMVEKGTAGLSLRAIAREMDITAPAIYNYFPSLDDLITALIVDAFNALADAMEAAAHHEAGAISHKIRATILAYRQWALAHPIQFQLIYGNPIPGYEAPGEITIPLAQRPFQNLFMLVYQAIEAGQLSLPPFYATIPINVEDYLQNLAERQQTHIPPNVFYMLVRSWSRIHGIVMLEIFGHIGPAVGDMDAFYSNEVDHILHEMGLLPDG